MIIKNNQVYLDEFKKFVKKYKLLYDTKTKKWNINYYPIADSQGYFKKFVLSRTGFPTCRFCGKILKGRQKRFCEPSHKVLCFNIIKRAKEQYHLLSDKDKNYDPDTSPDWMVFFPTLYRYSVGKDGKLREKSIKKDRIERRQITVTVNGKTYPLTKKIGTVRRKLSKL